MTIDLKVQRDIIALEAFSITNPTKLVSSHFPAMVSSLKNFLGKFKSDNPAIKLKSDQKEFLKKLKKLNSMDIENFTISTPEGFSGNLVEYSISLNAAAKQASKLGSELLNPFSVYLATLISSPNHRFDTSNYFTTLEEASNLRYGLFKDLTGYFGVNNPITKKLGDVVERNSDWDTILPELNSALTELNSINRNDLNKKVQEISSYLELIIKKVQNKELDGISPEVIRSLSEGVFQVATELERFTVIYYQAIAITKTVDEIVAKINKLPV